MIIRRDQEKQKENNPLEKCTQGQEAPCSCACPFQLDVRTFVDKIDRGIMGSAYSMYHYAVIFPAIVSRICPAPCSRACGRIMGEEAISLPRLEQSVYANARSHLAFQYNAPKKEQRVAVLGADLKGITCALRLAEKGYPVTVFESSDVMCRELEAYLPREIFEADIRQQFEFVSCEMLFHTDLETVQIEAYQAVFVSDPACSLSGETCFFPEGDPAHPVYSITSGARMAESMEWFLKTENRRSAEPETMVPKEADSETDVRTMPDKTAATETAAYGNAELPERQDGFLPVLGKAEARAEAHRCSRCDCSACLKQCVMLRQYGGTIAELSKSVGIDLNLVTHIQTHECLRQIGGCNFCGLCEKICPQHIDIGKYLLYVRTQMFEQGALAPAQHEYWMRDLAFADSEEAAVVYDPVPGAAKQIFFPGCQLGGSDPRYVSMTYEKLLELEPATALILRCCGVPALWAGDKAQFEQKLTKIRELWNSMGKPLVVLACPSCHRTFKEYLSEIPVKMVFETEGLKINGSSLTKAAVFDPCSSRKYPLMQQAVRKLVSQHMELSELPNFGELAQCCSWGGHAYTVNPKAVRTLAKEQSEQSDLPYITYCSNCRDVFALRGKETRHILDLINGINDAFRPVPTVSERRRNRRMLRKQLIEYYGIDLQDAPEVCILKLQMSAETKEKMNEDLILEEDLSRVILQAEKSGYYLIDPESGHSFAHLKIGLLTYWVEYQKNEDQSYTVYHAYAHRMSIKTDPVGET